MSYRLAGLGRHKQWDPNNRRYTLPLKATGNLTRRMWNGGQVWDQGGTPQCVGYSGYTWLRAGPKTNNPPFTPTELYYWAQDHDEWPGRDYEGSSSLGLMKALKEKGYISEYRWAFDTATIMAWVLTTGPVLVGTNWYMDMFTPTMPGDWLEPTGENAGGHEWLIIGGDTEKKAPDGSTSAFRMINTWGYGWSDNGRAWVSEKTLQKLLDENGDCVTPTELKISALNPTPSAFA